MITLVALISFPLIAAFLLLMVRAPRLRSVIVVVCSILISLGSMSLIASRFALPAISLSVPQETLSVALLALELGLCALILVLSIRHGKPLAGLLAVIQTALMTSAEVFFGGTPHGDTQLMADKLSVIIAVIVGVVGSLITVYALSYMKAHHARHPEVKDRRRFFFFLQFVFLSAMFGILFSNDLTLLHFFWEVTTLCSFLLIGYNGDTEGRNKAFLSLNMNLIGGIAFAAAILWASANFGIMQLDTLINSGKAWGLVPAMLLALAGMTKSAQLPFSSWLLGAMVAPTPVSALLHSSTMVKAGVYLMLRLAPVLQGSLPGVMVALVGGVTFLLTSLAAISQRDAKRVLAYSTIGNLALVVLCAGVGTYEAVWAGILLILFHAVTKCLLFLCVGSYEQKRGTRDIERMSGLIISMPRLSIMVQIGIAGMFLAPFGMLVSKWAVLKALVDFNPLLAVFVVFGSSATLFFWVKWMGKLLEVTGDYENVESGIGARQWISLVILSGLTVALVGFWPAVSALLIEPYVMQTYGQPATIGQGNIVIMSIMLALMALFPTTFFVYGRRVKVVDAYLGGANADSSVKFHGAAGLEKSMAMSNYYLRRIFGEGRLLLVGVITCTALILVMIGVGFM